MHPQDAALQECGRGGIEGRVGPEDGGFAHVRDDRLGRSRPDRREQLLLDLIGTHRGESPRRVVDDHIECEASGADTPCISTGHIVERWE